MRSITPRLALLLLPLAAPACGGEVSGPPEPELSRAEALALLDLLDGLDPAVAHLPDPPARETYILLDHTVSCPSEGILRSSGSFHRTETADARIQRSWDVIRLMETCGTALHPTGIRFELEGEPGLVVRSSSVTLPGGASEGSEVRRGTVAWRTEDGRSGHCAIDLAGDASVGDAPVGLAGSLCGHRVEVVTAPWTAVERVPRSAVDLNAPPAPPVSARSR